MNLYHWKGVLNGYAPGNIVVLAECSNMARWIALRELKDWYLGRNLCYDEDGISECIAYLEDVATIKNTEPIAYYTDVALCFRGSD